MKRQGLTTKPVEDVGSWSRPESMNTLGSIEGIGNVPKPDRGAISNGLGDAGRYPIRAACRFSLSQFQIISSITQFHLYQFTHIGQSCIARSSIKETPELVVQEFIAPPQLPPKRCTKVSVCSGPETEIC
jgi:hypothetical protein